MRPIEPAELSAFIDGELDAGRAAEVRAALASDAALRARYESLAHADAHLRSVAAGMTLSPRIRWPAPRTSPAARDARLWQALPVIVIPAAWLVSRLTELDWLAVVASALAFLTLLLSVVRLVLNEEDGPAAASFAPKPEEI